MTYIMGFVLALAMAQVVIVTSEDKSSEIGKAAKERFQQGLDLAKEGFAKAGDAFNQAKDKLGPLASNFSQNVQDKFHEGVQKAEEVLTQVKETVSSHVSPFVNKVRKGMLDGVRNLRDKLNKKNKTDEVPSVEGLGDSQKEASESGEKATVEVEINSEAENP